VYLGRGCIDRRLVCLCGFGCVRVFVLCCYVAGFYPVFFFLMEWIALVRFRGKKVVVHVKINLVLWILGQNNCSTVKYSSLSLERTKQQASDKETGSTLVSNSWNMLEHQNIL
jgi:hypothetical protein